MSLIIVLSMLVCCISETGTKEYKMWEGIHMRVKIGQRSVSISNRVKANSEDHHDVATVRGCMRAR